MSYCLLHTQSPTGYSLNRETSLLPVPPTQELVLPQLDCLETHQRLMILTPPGTPVIGIPYKQACLWNLLPHRCR